MNERKYGTSHNKSKGGQKMIKLRQLSMIAIVLGMMSIIIPLALAQDMSKKN